MVGKAEAAEKGKIRGLYSEYVAAKACSTSVKLTAGVARAEKKNELGLFWVGSTRPRHGAADRLPERVTPKRSPPPVTARPASQGRCIMVRIPPLHVTIKNSDG